MGRIIIIASIVIATLVTLAPQSAEASATCAIEASRAIPSAQAYFDTLPDRFDAASASRTHAVVQWNLGGPCGGAWHAVIDGNELTVKRGTAPNPTLTITMAADDYVAMVNLEVNGRWLFVSGKGKVDGSIPLAMKLDSIFPLGG